MTKITRPIAEMSVKTVRAAEKLRKQWDVEKEKITQQALQEVKAKIHQWIADNAKYRVPVSGKRTISLFSRNEDSASVSNKIKRIASQLYHKNS